jgi:endonuclease YncB( thermonuclease family)
MYEYAAVLSSVHDGDTATFMVDLGFGIYSMHVVRFAGINAPELRTDAGKASLAWVYRWFAENPGPCVLRTRKGRETEKYGRYLAVVVSLLSGRVLNDDIVAAGQAVPYNP